MIMKKLTLLISILIVSSFFTFNIHTAAAVTVSGTCNCLSDNAINKTSPPIGTRTGIEEFANECFDGSANRSLDCENLKMNEKITNITSKSTAETLETYDDFFSQAEAQEKAAALGGTTSDSNSETPTTTGTGEAAATAEKLPNLLGTDDPNIVIGRIIKFIIGIAGSAALLMFVYGGFLWLISGGRSEYIEKGKKTMMYAIVGLIVIFSSYTAIKLILSAVGALAK